MLTLFLILSLLSGGVWFSYGKALAFIGELMPELKVIPQGLLVYSPDESLEKNFRAFKGRGYSLLIPKDAQVEEKEKDPNLYIYDRDSRWSMVINEKLIRYEDSIVSDKHLINPDGDYYILLKSIYEATADPVLLFQKKYHLPSRTKKITSIKTPYCEGFLIITESSTAKYYYYRLFDDDYWYNASVTLYDDEADMTIKMMMGSLRHYESLEETQE